VHFLAAFGISSRSNE